MYKVIYVLFTITVFAHKILPSKHLITNSGDATARSTICVMPSRRQNRRWEKTAMLIVLNKGQLEGCVEIGADGNGDRRQSFVRLFFLSFFAVRVLSFPPDKKRGGGRPTGPPRGEGGSQSHYGSQSRHQSARPK
jgi:hypothetical protein